MYILKLSKTIVSIVLVSCIIIIVTMASLISAYYPFFQISILGQKMESDSKLITEHTPGYPSIKSNGDILNPMHDVLPKNGVVEPMKYLREFNYGKVSKLPNGVTLREFTLIASDDKVKEISPGVFYNVWAFNGTVPGPTIRATEGDIVKINFINNGSKPHSLHTHGIHPSEMDGVFEMIPPKGKYTYQFIAQPYGVFPYHCHMSPLEEHISHGLYGVYIVDPKIPRPTADEMVMVMNGYDTDFDRQNNFYTVNGIPFYYLNKPIQIEKDTPIRIYLVNMLEFDPINNFHLHANMFNYYPSGTRQTPDQYTDIISQTQGERGILEFNYTYPGKYMFHAHITEFSEKGWMGIFDVKDNGKNTAIAEKIQKNYNSSLASINNVNYGGTIEDNNSSISIKSQITNTSDINNTSAVQQINSSLNRGNFL